MIIRPILVILLILTATISAGCSLNSPQPASLTDQTSPISDSLSAADSPGASQTMSTDTFFGPARLLATQDIALDIDNEEKLNALGLGGSFPQNAPPDLPFNSYGLYWSGQFSLVSGDRLNVRIQSDSLLSWFGLDWSNLDVRGVFALTDIDEDGWNFIPLYPDNTSVEKSATGTEIDLDYIIQEDGEYQILIKNSSIRKSNQLSLALLLQGQLAPSTSSSD